MRGIHKPYLIAVAIAAGMDLTSAYAQKPAVSAAPTPRSKNNRRDKLITNAYGSVDLFFDPKAPVGKEANWTATVPGKGWFTVFRLFGPLEPWFDKTWRPGEIELVK